MRRAVECPMDIRKDLDLRVTRLERLFARRMGVRKGDLVLRVKRLRGALPEAVRRDALALAKARHLSGHPKIAKQMDARALARTERRVRDWLTGPVLRERRVTRRLRWTGALVLNLALMGAGLAGLFFYVG